VAVGLLRIAESILRDQRTVLSVSSLVPGEGKTTTVELETREWDYYVKRFMREIG
jgi:hypothetical protein